MRKSDRPGAADIASPKGGAALETGMNAYIWVKPLIATCRFRIMEARLARRNAA